MKKIRIGLCLIIGILSAVCMSTPVAQGSPRLTPQSTALYELYNWPNDKCLDANVWAINADGDYVQLWQCNAQAQQSWSFDYNLPSTPIVNGMSGLCLDADASGSNLGTDGDKVQLWHCNGEPQQQWWYDNVGGAWHNVGGFGKCLDADANAIFNGTKIQLWSCNGEPQQEWATILWGSAAQARHGRS